MGKIKALGKSGQQPKQNKTLNARDQMLNICNTIWTSRQPEQIKGCEKMLETYIKANGNENIGVTFIEIELSRQKRLNILFEKMGGVQKELQKQNHEKKKILENPISNEMLKTKRIKEIESEQTKIMNKKFKDKLN